MIVGSFRPDRPFFGGEQVPSRVLEFTHVDHVGIGQPGLPWFIMVCHPNLGARELPRGDLTRGGLVNVPVGSIWSRENHHIVETLSTQKLERMAMGNTYGKYLWLL